MTDSSPFLVLLLKDIKIRSGTVWTVSAQRRPMNERLNLARHNMFLSSNMLHARCSAGEWTDTQPTDVAQHRSIIRRHCLDILLFYITDNRQQHWLAIILHHVVLIPHYRLRTHGRRLDSAELCVLHLLVSSGKDVLVLRYQHFSIHQELGYTISQTHLLSCRCKFLWWLIVQCFTSPPTQYRLYGRRFLQVKDPTNSIKVLKEMLQRKKQRTKTTKSHI